MKNTQDIDIICNMDKIPVVDIQKGTFLLPFNFEQQKAIKYCLDMGYSIRGFAYTALPIDYMNVLIATVFENSRSSRKPTDLEIWKTVHTDLTIEQFEQVLIGYTNNLDMLDRIENIKTYSPEILSLINTAKNLDEDIIDYALTNNNYNDLVKYVNNIELKSKNKELKEEKIRHLLYG